MKQRNIWNYLKLDSFDVEIPFSKSRTEIIRSFNESNIPISSTSTETEIVVVSKILSLDVDFSISLQFSGEKLIAIWLVPDPALGGETLYSRYNKIQKALENELGYPYNLLLRPIMNLLDPGRISYWQRDGIKIKHYLLERFGMEEAIDIKL